MKIFTWLSHNLLTVILLLVVAFLLLRQRPLPFTTNTIFYDSVPTAGIAMSKSAVRTSFVPPVPESVPPTDTKDRLVITDTSLSLQVNDVAASIAAIEAQAVSMGGFLVNRQVGQPEGPASGSITVRVPAAKREDALNAFKNQAVKVVSENVSGVDVTDSYVDLEARLKTLEQTKAKFESMLTAATTVSETMEVQRELTNLQSQIDSLVGQKQYLEKSADLSKITVYLSTDDLALPYTPDQPWRPAVIFKQAVRSLFLNLRSLGNSAIYAFVYAPLWLPVLGIIWFISRRKA